MAPKTTPFLEKHTLEFGAHQDGKGWRAKCAMPSLKASPPIVETIIGDMFFRNDKMLDNAKDENEDYLVASEAAKAVAKKIDKKSSE
ncbi:unnamed protein product [Hyaloperonospora brassicae]|uniref:Uncharacterized protein n=1 Tax=Hyaloperonospora brassicae TaxID=162125 RepID=A0AAV0TWK0_HYABA|nr:unnamed protein product [Hyaloperonospora brassicae]